MDSSSTPQEELERAAAHLRAGGVVAAATESFFGLLADVTQQSALDAVFSLKPRGSDKGVPLLLPDRSRWPNLVRDIPRAALALADAFWPGPLSIALRAAEALDTRLLLDRTIAVRMPGPCVAAQLAELVRVPLTASSANRPGEPPATTSAMVEAAFPEAVASGLLLVLGGTSPGGAPSTVVVVEGSALRIAREAAIPASAIESVISRFQPA